MDQVGVLKLYNSLLFSSGNLLLFVFFEKTLIFLFRFGFHFTSPKMANGIKTLSGSFLKKSPKVSLCVYHIPCNILDILSVPGLPTCKLCATFKASHQRRFNWSTQAFSTGETTNDFQPQMQAAFSACVLIPHRKRLESICRVSLSKALFSVPPQYVQQKSIKARRVKLNLCWGNRKCCLIIVYESRYVIININ